MSAYPPTRLPAFPPLFSGAGQKWIQISSQKTSSSRARLILKGQKVVACQQWDVDLEMWGDQAQSGYRPRADAWGGLVVFCVLFWFNG